MGDERSEMMFEFSQKENNKKNILTPMNGTVIRIKDTGDEVFSQKMVGDGVTIIPSDGEVLSPVDGEIIQVFDTLHAYGIRSKDGVEILIHIGINTVELKGEGFKSFVKNNQIIKSGDKIAYADLGFLESKGYSLHTPVIITNMGYIKNISYNLGKVKAAKTPIIYYNK